MELRRIIYSASIMTQLNGHLILILGLALAFRGPWQGAQRVTAGGDGRFLSGCPRAPSGLSWCLNHAITAAASRSLPLVVT